MSELTDLIGSTTDSFRAATEEVKGLTASIIELNKLQEEVMSNMGVLSGICTTTSNGKPKTKRELNKELRDKQLNAIFDNFKTYLGMTIKQNEVKINSSFIKSKIEALKQQTENFKNYLNNFDSYSIEQKCNIVLSNYPKKYLSLQNRYLLNKYVGRSAS